MDIRKDVARYDVNPMGKAVMTDEGYIRDDVVLTRVGVFKYINADGSIRKELRHPDDVFNQASLDSFKMIPITNKHPEQRLVNARNAKNLTIGSVGENVRKHESFVKAPITINTDDGVKAVQKGRKELSLGYLVDVIKEDGDYNGESYTHRQTNIRGNHLAIVDVARAGRAARINLDSDDAVLADSDDPSAKGDNINNNKKVNSMSELKTIALDGIDYKASPEVLNKFNKLRTDNSELIEKNKKLQTSNDKLSADKVALDAKIEKLEKVDHAEEIEKAVKERVSLNEIAKKVLKADALEKLESMSVKDIKLAVIKTSFPKANLDEKSDDYIQGLYDNALDITKTSNKNMANQRKDSHDGKGSESFSNETAKAGLIDAMKKQHIIK